MVPKFPRCNIVLAEEFYHLDLVLLSWCVYSFSKVVSFKFLESKKLESLSMVSTDQPVTQCLYFRYDFVFFVFFLLLKTQSFHECFSLFSPVCIKKINCNLCVWVSDCEQRTGKSLDFCNQPND